MSEKDMLADYPICQEQQFEHTSLFSYAVANAKFFYMTQGIFREPNEEYWPIQFVVSFLSFSDTNSLPRTTRP